MLRIKLSAQTKTTRRSQVVSKYINNFKNLGNYPEWTKKRDIRSFRVVSCVLFY